MFRPNALKQRLRSGQQALGCWTVLRSPPVIELLALCGFDYLLLDQEHQSSDASSSRPGRVIEIRAVERAVRGQDA